MTHLDKKAVSGVHSECSLVVRVLDGDESHCASPLQRGFWVFVCMCMLYNEWQGCEGGLTFHPLRAKNNFVCVCAHSFVKTGLLHKPPLQSVWKLYHSLYSGGLISCYFSLISAIRQSSLHGYFQISLFSWLCCLFPEVHLRNLLYSLSSGDYFVCDTRVIQAVF